MPPQLRCAVRSSVVISTAFLLFALPTSVPAGETKVVTLNELVISDPGTQADGVPAVQFHANADGQSLKVVIPPKVHTHRFYYSGTREFQGPFVAGGPTVVVAAHPKCGELVYVDVMLPPGYPIIAYDDCSITYVYPERRVIIRFHTLICREKVTVEYIHGKGVGRTIHDASVKCAKKTKVCLESSPLVGAVRSAGKETGQLFAGAGHGVEKVAAEGVDTVKKLVGAVPGVQALQSYGKQSAEKAQTERLRQIGAREETKVEEFIKTNR